MRIWSIHPRYLDTKGLGGVWVETLLAKAVLEGKTKGYTNHPQLNRFRETSDPVKYVSTYLHTVYEEATKRGFKYNFSKVGEILGNPKTLTVTKGQLEYELTHLRKKLQKRSPDRYAVVSDIPLPDTHPLFEVVEGGIESWEILEAPIRRSTRKGKKKKETSESQVDIPLQTQGKRKRDVKPIAEVETTQAVEKPRQIHGKRKRTKGDAEPEVQVRSKRRKLNTELATEVKKTPVVQGKPKMSKEATESTTEAKKARGGKGKGGHGQSVSLIEKNDLRGKNKRQKHEPQLEAEKVKGGRKPASEKKPMHGKNR